MLDISPKLQVLKLINVSNVHQSVSKFFKSICFLFAGVIITYAVFNSSQKQGKRINGFVASVKWNQPKNVPQCLLFHLEIFVWKGYKWQRGDEKEVARYILGNTYRLKRATFYSKRISPEDEEDLKNVVRDTSSCQLLFK